jgi:hypothetical protein
MKTMWRLLLPIVLCVAALAQNNSSSSADIEMQQLSRLLAGRWSGNYQSHRVHALREQPTRFGICHLVD